MGKPTRRLADDTMAPEQVRLQLLMALQGAQAGGSFPLVVSPGSPTPVTVTSAAVGASGSGTIPTGSKEWSFTILTGTGTFNGVASLPAGFTATGIAPLVAGVNYATAAASSAYVQYAT